MSRGGLPPGHVVCRKIIRTLLVRHWDIGDIEIGETVRGIQETGGNEDDRD